MTINRHNYETYFILYLDNELTAADRRMVESFVQLHPDLKDELDLLSQFKLTPDTDIVFEGKEKLEMPQEASEPFISDTRLQNSLLLYIDGELTTAQQLSLEEIIATKPGLQAELDLLNRVKLEPEEIVFRDKNSLYRTEKTDVFHLPLRWWRVAAAAVLLVAVGLTTLIILNKKPAEPEIVESAPFKIEPSHIISEEATPFKKDDKQVAKVNEPLQVPVRKERNSSDMVLHKNSRTKEPGITVNKTVIQNKPLNETSLVTENKPSNNLPRPLNNTNIIHNNSNVGNAGNNTSASPDKNVLTNTVVTSGEPQPYIIQTSHTDHVAIEQPDSKKGKLRGFFRKVTRTLEKRTNIETTDDDNKLLVAGLAFKLK